MIFATALPGQPLPEVTVFILSYKVPLALLSLAWPVTIGVLIALRNQLANLRMIIGIVWNILLFVITILALFMPISEGPIKGMPETSHQDSSQK